MKEQTKVKLKEESKKLCWYALGFTLGAGAMYLWHRNYVCRIGYGLLKLESEGVLKAFDSCGKQLALEKALDEAVKLSSK